MAEYGWRNQRKCSIICVLVSFFQKIVLTQSLLLLLYEKIRIGNWCWNLQFIPPINLANILVWYITRFFFVGYYDKMLHLSYGNMIISSFVFLFLNWILQHANNFISTYLYDTPAVLNFNNRRTAIFIFCCQWIEMTHLGRPCSKNCFYCSCTYTILVPVFSFLNSLHIRSIAQKWNSNF